MRSLERVALTMAVSIVVLGAGCQTQVRAEPAPASPAPTTPAPTTPAPTTPAADTEEQPPCDPGVHLSPRSGPIGTRVRITGCLPQYLWSLHKQRRLGAWLMHDFAPRCQLDSGRGWLVQHADHSVNGRLVVESRGACKQEFYDRRVTPALYQLFVDCMACGVRDATFRVTRD